MDLGEGFTGGLAYVPAGTGSLLAGSLVGISGDGSGTTYLNTIDLSGTVASAFEVFVAGAGKSGSGDFSNGFDIVATHTYSQVATAPLNLTITITDVEPSQVPGSVTRSTTTDTGTVTVVPPPPQPQPAPPAFTAYEGYATGTLNLATFTIPSGAATANAAYSATINWGDGSSLANGTVSVSGATITVGGGHTYASPGTFVPAVVITDGNGDSATADATVDVLPNVTNQVHTDSTGPIYNPSTQLFNGNVTFTNTGTTPLNGPFPLVFQGLPSGVTLADATGTTGDGIPYVSDPLTTLPPGQSSTVPVQFSDPTLTPITYNLQVFDPPPAAPQVNYEQLPLSFQSNQGQANSQVQYLALGSGYALFLTPGQATLSLESAPTSAPGSNAAGATKQNVVQLRLVGADPDATVVALDEQASKSNYLSGSDASQWITNVPNYGEVEYQQVYPGIALLYHGNQGQLEYDFVLAPGANPGLIEFDIQGTQTLTIDAQGDLVLGTSGGNIVEHAPHIYQDINGSQVTVAGHYVLLRQDQVGFALGSYDTAVSLYIDPLLVYATYLTGSGVNNSYGHGIAVDAAGDAYVTGVTTSTQFPTTPPDSINSPPDPAGYDAFVTKFNADGSGLIYSTYLSAPSTGGNDIGGTAIAVDATGDAFLTGFVDAAGFPTTTNALEPYLDNNSANATPPSAGHYDAFFTELNANGSGLMYSTYLGGSGDDFGTSIALDSSGNAYVAGLTFSDDFPSPGTSAADSPFAANAANPPPGLGFVAKFNSSDDLVYTTAFGNAAYGIAVDAAGNAYVTGITGSTVGGSPTGEALIEKVAVHGFGPERSPGAR